MLFPKTLLDIEEATPDAQIMIREQIIPAAISYYQTALKVNPVATLKIAPEVAQRCGSVSPPSSLADGIDYDLALFIMGAVNEDSSSGASARPCVLAAPTERYIVFK